MALQVVFPFAALLPHWGGSWVARTWAKLATATQLGEGGRSLASRVPVTGTLEAGCGGSTLVVA